MSATTWGRVQRGVVWHLVTGPDSTLCEGGLYGLDGSAVAYTEVSRALPPAGGRPCPRCCAAVDDLADAVINAIAGQELRLPRAEPASDLGPPVELLAALTDPQLAV